MYLQELTYSVTNSLVSAATREILVAERGRHIAFQGENQTEGGLMEKSVALQVNQGKLIENLRFAFSDAKKVLTELAQNARRAGATNVAFDYDEEQHVLTVSDDGQGIADLQNLLTIAESGWDEAVEENEAPYGMGFMSSFYVCEQMVVESGFQRIAFSTAKVMAGDPVQVETSSTEIVSGARIVLQGFSPKFHLADIFDSLFVGYPIPVFLNGNEIARPLSLDSSSRSFVLCDVGHMSLTGVHNELSPQRADKAYMRYFLQGVELTSMYGAWRRKSVADCNVVHLDTMQFFGRMPDRDTLVDASECQKQVEATCRALWREYLESQLEKMPDREFVTRFFDVTYSYAPDLFNRITFLPAQFLESYVSVPFISEFDSFEMPPRHSLSRAVIESGAMLVCKRPGDMDEEVGALESMYLFLSEGAFVLNKTLPDGHWAIPFVVNLEQRDIQITLEGKTKAGTFFGNYVSSDVDLCSAYQISGKGLPPVRSDSYGVATANGFVIPERENDGFAVRQISSYIDENDYFDEEMCDFDQRELELVIANLRATSPAEVLLNILKTDMGYRCLKDLKGMSFEVSFGADGRLDRVA